MTSYQRPPTVVSLQSWVAYGHVGNAAAVFPLQRLGFDVWALHTVQFSNHTGYGTWKGQVFDAGMLQEIVHGMEERNAWSDCQAVLSGYLGAAAVGDVVRETVARVKRQRPDALYCCDPVMGDVGRGFFVRPEIPAYFRDVLLPQADLLTPNQFELEWLTQRTITTLEDAQTAVDAVHAQGPRWVLLTSLQRSETPPDTIEMLASGPGETWWVQTPRLPLHANGTGDTIAALFLGHFLRSGSLQHALQYATSGMFAVMQATHQLGTRELQPIAAQNELLVPSYLFAVQQIR